MGHWVIHLDKDWDRAGFDHTSIESEEIVVGGSERFTAELALVAVLTYVGGKVLDHFAGEAIKKAVHSLATFAQSQEKRLQLEFEEKGLDPRIKLVAAQIDSMDPNEFDAAIEAFPKLRIKTAALLDSTSGYIEEAWYVWKDGEWKFTFYQEEGGEFVYEDPDARTA